MKVKIMVSTRRGDYSMPEKNPPCPLECSPASCRPMTLATFTLLAAAAFGGKNYNVNKLTRYLIWLLSNVAIIVARHAVAIDLVVVVLHRHRCSIPSPVAPSPSSSSLSSSSSSPVAIVARYLHLKLVILWAVAWLKSMGPSATKKYMSGW